MSGDNSILDDVRAAAAEVALPPDRPIGIETPEKPVETPAEPVETAEQAAARARDDKGRFAKENEKPPEKVAKPPAEQRETLKVKDPQLQAAAEREIKATGEIKSPEMLAPPAEWKGAGKLDWNKLPESVKSEIKENWGALEKARAEFTPLQQAIAPHREVLERDAGSVQAGISQLMTFYNAYLTNPVGLIHHIARTRGIDLGQPQGQPQPGTPQAPDINSLIAQTVQQAIAPIQERFQQTETQQTEQTLSAFASDPKHPYFQDVRVAMGHLLTMGQAKTLEEAYEQAIWANPVIRPQLMQAQAESAAKTQAAEAAAARKAAAASLTGAPIAGAGAPDGRASKTESARDTVLKVYREQLGA